MEVTSTETKKGPEGPILYVITKSNWGGAQRYVYDLAVAAKKQGQGVLVACGGSGELIRKLIDAKIPVHQIGRLGRDIRIGSEWEAMKELIRLMKKIRPRVAHLNSSKAGLAACAARIAGVPRVVFTVHGWAWNENRPLWQKLLIRATYYVTLLLVDEALCVSQELARQAKWMPGMRNKLTVVHNGVHPQNLLPRAEARAYLVPSPTKPFWIGTIAELHPIKGLDVLIEAFEHLAADYPDVELVIMGEGEERGTLERAMKVEGVSGRAHLIGHVEQASTYLKALDLFVLPSRSEGLAYVLLEAGVAELPVVASNVGGIPEVITDGETGLLVPPDQRRLLTAAMERLMKNTEEAQALGTALHERVSTDFSLEHMVEKTFASYERSH